MTREEALARAAELNRAGDGRWVAHDAGGAWRVVKLSIPGQAPTRPFTETIESKPKPPTPADPRPPFPPETAGF